MQEITFSGNLCNNPELRVTNNGKYVCNFTVAVNRQKKDIDGNEVVDFFRVSAWNSGAEACANFLSKGDKVFVRGELQAGLYEGKYGTKLSLSVHANLIEFLTFRKDRERERDMERDILSEATPLNDFDDSIFPEELR